MEPTTTEPMVTIYTTFSETINGQEVTTVTSREETQSDILTASMTSQLENINNVEQTNGPQLGSVNSSGEAEEDEVIQSTIVPSLASAQVFTYYTSKYDGDYTIVETIQSTSGQFPLPFLRFSLEKQMLM